MTIFRSILRFTRDDYRVAPSWFLDFLDSLNSLVDEINGVLPGSVDLDNNILGERQTVALSHGVAVTVKLRKLTAIPYFVRVGYADGHVGYGAISTYNTDGTIQIKVYFQDAPTSPVNTTLYIEP